MSASKFAMDQLEVSEFGSRLQAIMASFDFDLGEFGRFLYQTRSVLSGSTMLNVVKPFTDSMKDLDVYTTMSMLPLWKAYLRAHGWIYDNTAYLHLLFHYRRGNRARETPILGVYGFYRVVDGERQMIDVIISRSGDPLDCIRFFDFSMLLNWFDGYRVFCADPQAIISKKPRINTTGNYIYGRRLVKYKTHRGYDIRTVDIGISTYHKYVPHNFLNEGLSFNELVNTARAPRTLVLKTGTVPQEILYRVIHHHLRLAGLPSMLIAYAAEFLFPAQFSNEPPPLFIERDLGRIEKPLILTDNAPADIPLQAEKTALVAV